MFWYPYAFIRQVVQMLSVVDLIMFGTNMSVIYNINKYTIFDYRLLRL